MTMDLRFYLSLFLRRLHYFLIIFALGSVIGLTLARILPPVYVAQALLVVESEQIPDSLAASTVQADAVEQLQIIQQRILTRQNLLDMANRLQIYAGSADRPALRLPADEIVEDMRKRIDIFTSGGGSRDKQVTLIRVGFQAETPQLAAAVANELVTMILRENVTMRTGVTGQTLEFFTEEVSRLDRELGRIGGRILEFKQENAEALPDSLDFRRSRLAAQQERLRDVEREEAGLKDRRSRLVTLFETTGRVDAGPTDRRLTPDEQRLESMRRDLDTALLTLSPQNPRIRMLEAQIAAQERVVAAAGGTAGADPGMSAFEIQLADLDGQLAFLAQRREDLAADMTELERTIAATPGNAIALGAMERDFANVQAQYNQAVANKARAETGDTIESLSRGQRISVIEQAVAPREPTRPNRPLIAAAGIGGGLLLGLGLVALLELLDRSIRRPQDLIAGLGITPFATLPLIRNEGELRRRRIVIALAFFVALVVIPLLLWVLHTRVMPLDLMADQLMRRARMLMQRGT